MALSLESISNVMQKARIDSGQKVAVSELLRALRKYLNDQLRNPDLQFVPFQLSATADTVIADAPCKLYFLAVTKPSASTTNAWVKGSNSATATAGAGDIAIPMVGTGGGGKTQQLCFPAGLPLSNGLTIASHTTVNGTTRSSAGDCSSGFAIIGGP
jgi:type II secretory pathway pseudopilin PulG